MELTRDTLDNILEQAGLQPREVVYDFPYSSYSGRGMYGKSCFALSLDYDGELHMFYDGIRRALDVAEDDDDYLTDGQCDLIRGMVSTATTDSLGKGFVAYWPHITLEPVPDDACVSSHGDIFPEHDFGDVECARCGAEPTNVDE